MNRYLVLKATGKGTKSGRSAVVVPLGVKHAKSIRVVGNIPELYHGMTIMLELKGNIVQDYKLVLNEKNLKALEKAQINTELYAAILERHTQLKKDNIGWNAAKLTLDDIYKVFPFDEADKIHKKMVDNPTEKTRIEAINRKIIEMARNRKKIAYKIEEYLSYFNAVEQEGAYQHLMVSLKILCLQAERYRLQNGTVWDKELKEKEGYVAETIKKRMALEYTLLTASEIRSFIDRIKDSGLDKEQIDTLWCLKTSVPCIITGGAGTGKTTVIKALIDCYAMHYSRDNILLVAPTGRASRRLAEKTGMPASTIHKALRKNPEDDFIYYTEHNPLPHRLIIVDESSMIDTALMYDLLSAVEPTSKIIFVGDHNQLYPVSYGEPFFDFLKELNVFTLTVNHRQDEETDILREANNVLDGKPVQSGRGITVNEIKINEIGNILHTADDNTQILSPYNALNAEINAYMKKGEDDFNVGDKVMALTNTKEYCNGDMGYITKIDENGTIAVDIDGTSVEFTRARYHDLTLAYAVTIHKMQGNEADRVIVFLPKGDSIVDKRMLYTAVTRARKMLEIYYYTEE
mgnify:FL=1